MCIFQLAADKLITGLTSEKNRWLIDLEQLHDDKFKVIGTQLISASFLAYSGPFSWEFRKIMIVQDWLNDVQEREIPISLPYRIDNHLTNDVEVST